MSRTALAALAAMSVVGLACSSSPRTSEIPPPRIDVLEPQEGSVLTSPTLVLSGRIDTPGAPLASAEYQVQGGDWAPLAVDEQGNFSATVAAPRAAGMMLSLKVRAANLAEKRSEKSVEVLVQNAGPTLEISSPVDGAILGPSAVDTVTFTGTSVDRVTQAPATITLDFHDGVGPRPLDNSAAGFSITVPLAEEDFVAHDVTLVATDARGNSTTATLRVYVDRVAPTLSVTAPAEGQKFARADFAQSDDLTGQFTAADGDPSPTVELDVGNGWQPVTGNGFVVPTSPTDDGVIYTLQLRATDRAGNITSVVRSFAVDRVAPVAAIDRADGSRLNPPSVMVTFSEPVTSAALPLTVTPAAGTPSGSAPFAGQSFSFTGLPGDTVFTASVAAGAVADAFGNVNETGASVKFHTRPAQPQTGTVLTLRNDVVAFDVASDPDGVVTLVMETTATSKPMLFTWFDGVTGALSSGVLGNRPSGDLVALSTAAWSNAHADLSSHRARGYREAYSAQTFVGGVNDGTLLPAAPGDVLFVPVGPGCADDPGAPEVGVITGAGAFVRGSVVEPVQVTPFQLLIESPNDWELVSVAGGTLVAQARTCSCGASASCAWQPARSVPLPFGYTVAATPRLSVAGTATGERRLYVADTTAGLRVEICEAQCTSTPCPSNGARLTLASEGLFVASANSGNEVIGAQKKAAGVQLVWRDLQASCTGDWSVLGIVPGSSGSSVTDWRPAMFGDRHGVLWLDGTTLKLYIP